MRIKVASMLLKFEERRIKVKARRLYIQLKALPNEGAKAKLQPKFELLTRKWDKNQARLAQLENNLSHFGGN